MSCKYNYKIFVFFSWSFSKNTLRSTSKGLPVHLDHLLYYKISRFCAKKKLKVEKNGFWTKMSKYILVLLSPVAALIFLLQIFSSSSFISVLSPPRTKYLIFTNIFLFAALFLYCGPNYFTSIFLLSFFLHFSPPSAQDQWTGLPLRIVNGPRVLPC